MDGIFHVCRAFDDPDVIHTEDRIDPVADLDIIHACAPLCLPRTCVRVSAQRAAQ